MNFLLKIVVACAAALLIPSFFAGALAVITFDGNSALMVWTAGIVAFTAMLTFLSIVGGGPILFCLCLGLLIWCFEDIAEEGLHAARRKARHRPDGSRDTKPFRVLVSIVPSQRRA